MRRIALILVLTLSFVSLGVPTSAAFEQVCGGSDSGTAIDCGGNESSTVLVNQPKSGSGFTPASSGPAKKYEGYDRLIAAPDGTPCLTVGYAEVGTVPADAAPAIPPAGAVDPIDGLYQSCPATPVQFGQAPGPLAPPASMESRAMVAARYWEQIPLPKPQPAIAPGRAITGKLAYLETKGELTHTYTNNTAFGPLEIVANGSYTVNWGDGATTGPHAFEGKAWPDGRITHDYLNIGNFNVVVTEKWTATWHFGGESGLLRTLQTTGRIDAFPVQQIQAVVGR